MGKNDYYRNRYLLYASINKPWKAAVSTLSHFRMWAHKNGIRAVEIAWPWPYGTYADFVGHEEFPLVIDRLMDEFSVSVHAPMANLAATDETQRALNLAEVIQCIRYAEARKQGEVLHVVHLADKEKRLPWARQSIYDATTTLKIGKLSALDLKSGLDNSIAGKFKVGFETLSLNVASFHRPADMKDLLGDNYGLVVDTGHLAGNEIPIIPTIEEWWDNIFEIHLSTTVANADSHCVLGTGLVNAVEVLDFLKDGGFSRVIVETFPKYEAASLAFLKRAGFM